MFILNRYFIRLSNILKSPKSFFEKMPKDSGLKEPFLFILISALISTIIFSFTTSLESFFLTGTVYYINAVGMTFITSFAGFATIRLFLRNDTGFTPCFSIFAYSAGVSVIGAGVPFLIWFAEIWKWWLIGTGLKRSLKFESFSVFVVIVVTIALIFVFFNTIVPAAKLG